MTNDINNIEQQFGRKSPFKVPEGYFENFADNFMANLPEQASSVVVARSVPLWKKHWRQMVAVAACLLAFVVCGQLYMSQQSSANENGFAQQAYTEKRSVSVEQVVDNSMMDTDDLYAYLSGND